MDARMQRSFDDIQQKHISRIFGRMLRYRATLGAVLIVAIAGSALLDPAPWRRAWMGILVVCTLTFFIYELRRFNREQMTARTAPTNLLFPVVFLHCLIVGTGGLASPLLPLMIALAFVGAISLPRVRHLRVFAFEMGGLLALSAAQLSGLLPGLPLSFLGTPPRSMLVAVAGVMLLVLVFVNAIGVVVRRTFDDMLIEALAQREELLSTHRSYARALEAMSGEIAHELKNPLATVKGLTQLMVREAGRAQPTERLEVLSTEVVRMQGILEEFLNFSRPLVPLSVSAVDLAALCDEALVLHEGLAAERGLRLERVGPGSVQAVCDSRKVKQVVMNLLHNAIEASPPGARVTVEVGATHAGDARVSIRDEGPGLSPEVAGRVFDAGVTTKAKGSGLGLTVARALARQHGGEVSLKSGEGSGCVAELVLPRELPADTLRPVREREVAHAG
ncbi:HAMP domain-containing histidine kinase [Pyxidicoccus fallax]|uniref:histidine kinase n=1 Tax=Pyxidicoccus fallax TaxID=394095 RepID=A0A848LPW1_9BACT|nr:HAMP domain-containing sensor histidine kinase [Pyxidicoccus fallax]NMO19731.1 HAMP domain-containing histidine kinase [Pyxidicoccus fallax]NPC84422.1 HAMP domain-containing histidine kinase [Pyxidicoccus fallax]